MVYIGHIIVDGDLHNLFVFGSCNLCSMDKKEFQFFLASKWIEWKHSLFNWDILQYLQELDLVTNQLNGIIPDLFGNLQQLQSLNLFSNRLNGNIPDSFGK